MKSLFVLILSFAFVALAAAKEIRIGLIGLDTSHVIAFTKAINDPKATGPLASAKVVAAFKGGSLDVPSSAGRVEKFTKTLSEDYGLKLYPSIAELCKNVDAVMIESVDGRPHLRQAIPVIDAGLPCLSTSPWLARWPTPYLSLTMPGEKACLCSAPPPCVMARPHKPRAMGLWAK